MAATMASSSDDDDFNYRRPYPLHDAAEAGDMETLLTILRPPQNAKQPSTELPAAAPAAGDGDPSASGGGGGGGGEGGVVPMDEEGGEGGATKARPVVFFLVVICTAVRIVLSRGRK